MLGTCVRKFSCDVLVCVLTCAFMLRPHTMQVSFTHHASRMLFSHVLMCVLLRIHTVQVPYTHHLRLDHGGSSLLVLPSVVSVSRLHATAYADLGLAQSACTNYACRSMHLLAKQNTWSVCTPQHLSVCVCLCVCFCTMQIKLILGPGDTHYLLVPSKGATYTGHIRAMRASTAALDNFITPSTLELRDWVLTAELVRALPPLRALRAICVDCAMLGHLAAAEDGAALCRELGTRLCADALVVDDGCAAELLAHVIHGFDPIGQRTVHVITDSDDYVSALNAELQRVREAAAAAASTQPQPQPQPAGAQEAEQAAIAKQFPGFVAVSVTELPRVQQAAAAQPPPLRPQLPVPGVVGAMPRGGSLAEMCSWVKSSLTLRDPLLRAMSARRAEQVISEVEARG